MGDPHDLKAVLQTRPVISAMTLKKSSILSITLAGAFGLTGCAYAPAKDAKTGAELQGPITMGDSRAPVLGTCRSTFMYSGTCDLIFTDLHGRHVDGLKLAGDLDRAATNMAPLKPWASRSFEDSQLPYDLYLLTISPAIALAVPLSSGPRTHCSSVYQEGCIQSQGFRRQAYWYRSVPPVRAGSFWFAVGVDAVQSVDATASKVKIVWEGAEIQLTRSGEDWSVYRTK